ncbi:MULTISPECIES: serine/threonine-protein kinase [Prauserella salsuginis group]|uniref:Serine/threonine-protein kinase n=1 Tax=Prauserella salsuginis TaxID=387889 RepID=A0ABW6G8P4_9PSEU|nr:MULTISPECIES: serine/threonine-protein kinase [Prauserella salsuginis group]MCR3722567.1 Serine/threonine protein kinase [Prauserella flava]MCR3737009.1 Serine/threonine protein kinase [Prauserella salsuginis]
MKVLGEGDREYAGRYRLLAMLGEGGMGRVYLAMAPDGRPAALKRIHPAFSHDQGFRERFRREVATSRQVSGAFTAAVMDADTEAEQQWLASVYVAGPSLQDAIDTAGPLPPMAVRHLAAGLVSALADIHRAGLVHRDLKPSNVLLASDGPRVIDFGIARAVEGSSELTSTGSVVGSAGFTSPEQAEGRSLTTASDIFSLGTLLVMAATGKSPYAGNTTPQTLYNVVHGEPDLSKVPPELMSIIGPCLARDPAQRPTPDQLRGLIGSLPPTNNPWPERVQQEIRRCEDDVDAVLVGSDLRKSRSGLVVALASLIMVAALGVTALIGVTHPEAGTATTVAAQEPDPIPTTEAPTGPLAPTSLRKLDPCKLIPSLNSDGSTEYDECRFDVSENMSVTLELGSRITSSSNSSGGETAGLTTLVNGPDEGRCAVAGVLPQMPTNGIEVSVSWYGDGKPGKDHKPCEAGREYLGEAVKAARKGDGTWAEQYRTLAEVDPCLLISRQRAQDVFGQTPSVESDYLRECTYSGGGEAVVALDISGNPEESSSESTEKIEVGGKDVYQRPSSTGSASCSVEWPEAPVSGEDSDYYAQVVEVSYRGRYDDQDTTADLACERARKLADAVMEGLPTS